METIKDTALAASQGCPIPTYVLDDLCSRFIINIPDEERQDLIRVFFQIELAHWFYLDFYCAENVELRTCGIKDFSAQIFKHCPFLSGHAGEVDKILDNWKSYKMSVPTYGAILLDPEMKYVKISHLISYVHKVDEETGFDITPMIDKNEFIENYFNDQLSRLYIIKGVGLDTKFQPKTRKEIKSLQWFPVEALPAHRRDQTPKSLDMNPNNFFMVIPFIKPLRKWISKKLGQTYLLDAEYDIKGGNLSGQKQMKARDQPEGNNRQFNEGRATQREKQKQKVQQYFAQQNHNEFQEYMQHKEKKQRSDSPRKEAGKVRGIENKSPKPNKKQHYSILNRDGTVTGAQPNLLQNTWGPNQLTGQPKRNLGNPFNSPGGYMQGPRLSNYNNNSAKSPMSGNMSQDVKQRPRKYKKITDPDGLGSEAWLNFQLNVNAIMACLP
eukprot:XP_011457038.1 PREDICTED: m7GpppN-mRNA hydrolase [Crassostrea gigas]